jgi:DNA-binding MarR family transcriptional regulator
MPGHDGTNAGSAILRAADELGRRLAALTEPRGVTPQQLNVLRILAGAHPNPLQTLEIGTRLPDRTPGTSRLLDRLAAKGLVRRQRPAANRRIVHCTLTPAGLEIAQQLEGPVAALEQEVLAALGAHAPETVAGLARVAERLAVRDGHK